jgi:hypothetical protein
MELKRFLTDWALQAIRLPLNKLLEGVKVDKTVEELLKKIVERLKERQVFSITSFLIIRVLIYHLMKFI